MTQYSLNGDIFSRLVSSIAEASGNRMTEEAAAVMVASAFGADLVEIERSFDHADDGRWSKLLADISHDNPWLVDNLRLRQGRRFKEVLKITVGVVLVCGPIHSGKKRTAQLAARDINRMTGRIVVDGFPENTLGKFIINAEIATPDDWLKLRDFARAGHVVIARHASESVWHSMHHMVDVAGLSEVDLWLVEGGITQRLLTDIRADRTTHALVSEVDHFQRGKHEQFMRPQAVPTETLLFDQALGLLSNDAVTRAAVSQAFGESRLIEAEADGRGLSAA